MTDGYSTSVNQIKNNTYNYNPNQSPNLVLEGYVSEYNYTDLYDGKTMELYVSDTENGNKPHNSISSINMGVNYNYTFYIESINESDRAFNLQSRKGSNGFFLPLKSISYAPSQIQGETGSLPQSDAWI